MYFSRDLQHLRHITSRHRSSFTVSSLSGRDDILLGMEYVLRIWKLKRPKRDDDDDMEYIIGTIIALVAVVVGYIRHH